MIPHNPQQSYTGRLGLSRPQSISGSAMPISIQLQPSASLVTTKSEVNTEQSKQASINAVASSASLVSGLSGHIKNAFEAAKQARLSSGIDDLLISCLNMVNGNYDPTTLARIRAATPGGSEVFMMLADVKSRACASILRSTMIPAGQDKPWSISPSPVPDLPQEVQVQVVEQVFNEVTQVIQSNGANAVSEQEIDIRLDQLEKKVKSELMKVAKEDCLRMEKHIDDQLTEGKFYDAFADFLTDISIFPTAFIKGPVVRNRPRLIWKNNGGPNAVPAVEKMPRREYYRLSPFDSYPSPGAKHIQDGYFCEHHRLRRSQLNTMIGVSGFKDSEILAVLDEYGRGGLRNWLASDFQRAQAEGRPNEDTDPDPVIDALEYWGFAQGRDLISWGMSDKIISNPLLDYQITAWLIGTHVVMARLNPQPMGARPYFSESYSKKTDSVWGKSPPMLMKDTQNICNAVARALLNRMAFASGPITEIFWDRLAPGEDPTAIKPWMLIKTKSDVTGRASSKAVYLTDIDPRSEVFLTVYKYFFNQASEQTGIPNYIYGDNTGDQAHKTSSGLSMLLNNANALMRDVIFNIDKSVIKPIIYNHWLNIMLYDSDVPKNGDVFVKARASEYLIEQEQLQIRRNEALLTTNNPWDMRIIGDRGRAAMLRDGFKAMKMDVDDILPSDDEMSQREQNVINQLMARVQELEGMVGSQGMMDGGGQQPNDKKPNQNGNQLNLMQ